MVSSICGACDHLRDQLSGAMNDLSDMEETKLPVFLRCIFLESISTFSRIILSFIKITCMKK